METKCLHDLKLSISILIRKTAARNTYDPTCLVLSANPLLGLRQRGSKAKQIKTPRNANQNNDSLWDCKKISFQQKSCSVPSPSQQPLEFAQVLYKRT